MDPRIGRSIDYIHANYSAKIRLLELSRECGLSTQHFVYLFKKEVRLTFKAYLKRFRIHKSKQMIRDPYLTITEVSLEVGYQDLSNFERDFKKLTKLTPTGYRKTLSNNGGRKFSRNTVDFSRLAEHL